MTPKKYEHIEGNDLRGGDNRRAGDVDGVGAQQGGAANEPDYQSGDTAKVGVRGQDAREPAGMESLKEEKKPAEAI